MDKRKATFFLLYIFQSSAKSVDKVYLCDHIVLIVENNILIAAIWHVPLNHKNTVT